MVRKRIVKERECNRCGYKWFPRVPKQEPKTCAMCRSPYWNKPRVMRTHKKNRAKKYRGK